MNKLGLAVALASLSLAGCKIVIESPPVGHVESLSGAFSCAANYSCEIDVTDIYFNERFVAVSDDPNYEFSHWRRRGNGLCGGNAGTCDLSTNAFEGNDGLMAILESDERFYLEPVFRYIPPVVDPDPTPDPDPEPDPEPQPDPAPEPEPTPEPEPEPTPVHEISGGILEDTTLALTDYPYKLTGKIQVAEGATLTILEGVEILGNLSSTSIEVFGSLSIQGSNLAPVVLNDVYIQPGRASSDVLPSIEVSHAFIRGGSVLDNGMANTMDRFVLQDSVIESPITPIILFVRDTDTRIERNSFRMDGYANSFFIRAAVMSDALAVIRNNAFSGYQYSVVELQPRGSEAGVIVLEANSFLSVGTPSVSVSKHADGDSAIALGNYWGTRDSMAIEAMIIDKEDDLSLPLYIEYLPVLEEPHPDTPPS